MLLPACQLAGREFLFWGCFVAPQLMNMWISWVLLALLLFWAVGAYNRLVRLRSAAIQAFGALDAELLRRTALLGEYDAVVAGPRVPQDAQLHESLRASGTQYAASLAVMRSRPLDEQAGAALVAAGKVLDAAWQTLVEASQAQSSQDDSVGTGTDSTGSVQTSLQSLIERSALQRTQIDLATAQFNAAVDHYNKAVAQFPASMLAGVFGFKRALML